MKMYVRYYKPRTRLLILEKSNDRDIIPLEHAIEHVVGLLEIGSLHGDGAILNKLFLNKRIPCT